MPEQRYYNVTVIDPTKGERMFCTEKEALDAGWRKSKI
jgi:micrococcal nuclease